IFCSAKEPVGQRIMLPSIPTKGSHHQNLGSNTEELGELALHVVRRESIYQKRLIAEIEFWRKAHGHIHMIHWRSSPQ
ncbi:MAG: hypothetical protein AAF330_04650, partial [Pseudomonadota bacterium]